MGPIIPPHGGYEGLKAFEGATILYDATVVFCDQFVGRRSRTHDQMVQAARSGRQNIAEGSQVSGTSKEMELKLVSVARASLEELLKDYQDFLRQKGLPLWPKEHPQAQVMRRLAYSEDRSYASYRTYIEDGSAETAANTLICLTHQTNFLLDRLLRRLEEDFVKDGGFRERLYQARRAYRG